MANEPECPAPPCLGLDAFIRACRTRAAEIGTVRPIWLERNQHQDGFYSRAHFVALDVDGGALFCSRRTFDKPRNLADVERFLAMLRGLAGLA